MDENRAWPKLTFKVHISNLDDGMLLEIETQVKGPGYGPDYYRGAFAGLEAVNNTTKNRLEAFFRGIANQAGTRE